MKRKKFEGIDKKIIDLIKTYGSMSIVELANYLQVSRSYIGRVVDSLVKSGKLTKSLILNSDSEKYYPNTFIISLPEKIDNANCTKGGKAKKAPYETTHARIPTEIKPVVENLSNTYKHFKENNDIESIEKLLNNSSNEYLTKESALILFNQLIEVIENQEKELKNINGTINQMYANYVTKIDLYDFADAIRLIVTIFTRIVLGNGDDKASERLNNLNEIRVKIADKYLENNLLFKNNVIKH